MGLIREDVKYYFADFVRKGGEGIPQLGNLFFDQNHVFFEQKTQFLAFLEKKFLLKSVKGGRGVPPETETPFLPKILFVKVTDKIRKVVFDVFPNSCLIFPFKYF